MTEELARWPTQLEVRVVSNKHERLNETFRSWELPDTIQVVGAPSNLSHPYELAWIHRDLMQAAFNTGALLVGVHAPVTSTSSPLMPVALQSSSPANLTGDSFCPFNWQGP